MQIRPYTDDWEIKWNEFVEQSRNATFLFDRKYMNYHQDRFKDVSLLFLSDKNKLMGLLPASFFSSKTGEAISSHAGLTYGGFLLGKDTSASDVEQMMLMAIEYYKSLSIKTLLYKPIPYIYSAYPSQEDLYFLHKMNAVLVGRALSSAIYLPDRLPFSELRRRKIKKAGAEDLRYENVSYSSENKNVWSSYWALLSQVLTERHGVMPVHSLEEMSLLAEKFPQNIHLFVAMDSDDKICAGTVVYESNFVAHLQYIACSDYGLYLNALDGLIAHLITDVFPYKRYLDFGISTEENGTLLNHGLIFQKQGFGGRGICYDCYKIEL